MHYIKQTDKRSGEITYFTFKSFEELLEHWNIFEPIGYIVEIKQTIENNP